MARKFFEEMYRLSRPKIADEEYPCDAHLPSTILRDSPWDMSIRRPLHPSNWLDSFLEEEAPKTRGKREFPEAHAIRCEFCGQLIYYKTRRPLYNVCSACRLRIVKSRERGSFADIIVRTDSVLDTDDLVTPSLPPPMFSSSKERTQVSRLEWAHMAPVDSRGGAGTRGTEITDESVVSIRGEKRIRAALWLREQMRRRGANLW